MALLLTMLPFYLMGNVHCAGMCGPLVCLLAKHRFRYFYFLGRTVSFALCGLLAGTGGAVLTLYLQEYYLGAAASLIAGLVMVFIGVRLLFGMPKMNVVPMTRLSVRINRTLSVLMLQDNAWTTFLFGFFTVVLPCGQTLIVFSACALSGDSWTGFINGLCFALLTSPSLVAAMSASSFLSWLKAYYSQTTAIFVMGVGLIATLRGLADLGVISHLVLSEHYHFVIY